MASKIHHAGNVVNGTSRSDHDYLFKIVIIGDSGVGKSSLLLRFADDTFTESHISTIGVDYRFRTVRPSKSGKCAKLQIWDTAGQERFRTVTAAYYRGADGIIVVYDASNLRTFNHVREWLLEVSKHTHPDTAKLLVGNKSDKVDKFVSTEKGRALANSMNVKFMECSAKLGTNIDDIFQLMTLDLISSRETVRVKAEKQAAIDSDSRIEYEDHVRQWERTHAKGTRLSGRKKEENSSCPC